MDVSIRTARGEMAAYLCPPPGVGPWPGVVVIHDALGVTHDLHRQADWLASEGFLALAPDLFYWSGRWTCLFAYIRDWAKPLGDLDAARAWLAGRHDCTLLLVRWSLVCTASNKSRSRMAGCSPFRISPLKVISPM